MLGIHILLEHICVNVHVRKYRAPQRFRRELFSVGFIVN